MSRRKTYTLHEVVIIGLGGTHTAVFWTRADADAFLSIPRPYSDDVVRCVYRGTSQYPRAWAVKVLGEPPADLQQLQQRGV